MPIPFHLCWIVFILRNFVPLSFKMSVNNINGKKYGLIIPNKKPAPEPTRPSVTVENAFAEDSDGEDDKFVCSFVISFLLFEYTINK